MTKGWKTVKVEKLHVSLVVAVLLAGCASQPTQMQKAAAEAAAKKSGTYTKEDTGPFRKVVRDGKNLYCDNGPQLGSKLAKPYCLTEDQYAPVRWSHQLDLLAERLHRDTLPGHIRSRAELSCEPRVVLTHLSRTHRILHHNQRAFQ